MRKKRVIALLAALTAGLTGGLTGGLGLIAAAAGDAAPAGDGAAGNAAGGTARASGLEHMGYAAARAMLLTDGWQPLAGGCEVPGRATCGAFPEVGSCSGVAPGQCGMVFVQRDRCLYLTTSGGQPGGPGADPRVESVTFRPGPCAKQ